MKSFPCCGFNSLVTSSAKKTQRKRRNAWRASSVVAIMALFQTRTLLKIFCTFVVLLTVTNLHAQTPSTVPSADEILKPAYAKAAAGNKNVLLIFHASWCGWCRKMDASLQDSSVKPLIDRSYEVVHLTVYETANKKHLENAGALQFLTKHGGADKGLPYWYILDKEGTVLSSADDSSGKNTGCPATEAEVDHFIRILKKTSLLRDDELARIKKRFRQNEQ